MKKRDRTDPLVLHLAYELYSEPKGRRKLTNKTYASESKVRTNLEELRKRGLVRMEKRGTILTEKGKEYFQPVFTSVDRLKKLNLEDTGLKDFCLAASLKGINDLNCEPWQCHDLAVKNGASGSLVLEIDSGLRFADTGEELKVNNPVDRKKIISAFPDWERVNYLVIVSGNDYRSSDRGLWRIISEITCN